MTHATDLILDNARLVLADRVVTGHLVLREGRIAEIGEGAAPARLPRLDCEGDLVAPGIVELHTDHLEGHVTPRPKVIWDLTAALQAHDAQVAASGITTVFDALRAGADKEEDTALTRQTRLIAEAIDRANAEGRLRAEHFIHVRCEVSAHDTVAEFEAMADNPRTRLASLMDHAPGQRQFTNLEAYKTYYQGKKNLSDAEFEAFSAERIAQSERNAPGARRAIARSCQARGIALASHDDATPDHVAEAVDLHTTIAEFPTTHEAAIASRASAMHILMGAPNIVRGGSHSGNISAADLLAEGHLDILSSDYVPFSLLQAGARLVADKAADWPAVFALLAANPAKATGLDDRGRLETGLRADLVRFRASLDGPPVIRDVWREGVRVI